MNEVIFFKVRELIAQTKGIDPETISLDMTFDQLSMDSLDGLSLIGDLEEAFNVSVPNEEVLGIRTVRQIVDSLSKVVQA